MRRFTFITLLITAVFFLAACNSVSPNSVRTPSESTTTNSEQGNGMMGMGGSMMARHRAPIPSEYAGLVNPITADDDSILRGGEIYASNCASCHGDGGMGDGPAAAGLDPLPAPIAHTSQMMGDDYLFWRISEGGAMEPFNSSMIAWKTVLDENDRWDVINYVQAIGSGQAIPRQNMGGAPYDRDAEALRQAEMLTEAVTLGVITEAEAELFVDLHEVVDRTMALNRDDNSGNMDQRMVDTLAQLVASGELTQAQADNFTSIHDRLTEAGLMR